MSDYINDRPCLEEQYRLATAAAVALRDWAAFATEQSLMKTAETTGTSYDLLNTDLDTVADIIMGMAMMTFKEPDVVAHAMLRLSERQAASSLEELERLLREVK